MVQNAFTISCSRTRGETVPAEVEAVTEVTRELVASSFNILHDEEFQPTNEEDNFPEAVRGDGVGAPEGSTTVGDILEVDAVFLVNGGIPVNSHTGQDLSGETKLADTSVLEFNVTKTFELSLVSVSDQVKAVEESKLHEYREIVSQ